MATLHSPLRVIKLVRCLRVLNTRRISNLTSTNSSSTVATSSNPPKLFDKILIANRGEIACRIIRTARRLGIKTVAVYSDADHDAQHVILADEAVYIGPSPALESYLVGPKLINACKATGAKAVHPGYGFLSENLHFCQLCQDASIEFIGPTPYAISAMGSKSESKQIMIKAGVPVTPGYHGQDNSTQRLLEEARRIGWPVMIKAVAGGGGKGMRAVSNESYFMDSLNSCRRECLKSFGDDAVLIEKLVINPRHVELQVFGDKYGNAVHLLERDCSIQRRHQKVLEEAPAHNLDAQTRKAMGDAAVACALAVGYVGAGTVEFLVDPVSSEFYFCEMNTRLQVEHPVTELVTKQDLVEWQLRVASGFPLPLTQEQIIAGSIGCAVEARIYAENPQNDFLPTSGRLFHVRTPDTGAVDGLRVDSGVVAGDTVSTFYDPMIAKLIAYADTREEALSKLEAGLRNYQVSGLANNIDFLVKVVRHPGFSECVANTGFFSNHLTCIQKSLNASYHGEKVDDHLRFGIVIYMEALKQSLGTGLWSGQSIELIDWRNLRFKKTVIKAVTAHGIIDVEVGSIEPHGTTSVSLSRGNSSASSTTPFRVHSKQLMSSGSGSHSMCSVWDSAVEFNGCMRKGTVSIYTMNSASSQSRIIDVWLDGCTGDNSTHYQFSVPIEDFSSTGDSSSKHPIAFSPMPGKIIQVVAIDGSQVQRGDPIAILEAMKMEHVVCAPTSGTVRIFCEVDSIVNEGDKLAEVIATLQTTTVE